MLHKKNNFTQLRYYFQRHRTVTADDRAVTCRLALHKTMTRKYFRSAVFTNNETLVSQVEIGAIFGVSDHHQIRFKINAKRKIEQNTALVPDFRKANYQGH